MHHTLYLKIGRRTLLDAIDASFDLDVKLDLFLSSGICVFDSWQGS